MVICYSIPTGVDLDLGLDSSLQVIQMHKCVCIYVLYIQPHVRFHVDDWVMYGAWQSTERTDAGGTMDGRAEPIQGLLPAMLAPEEVP